MSVMFNRHKTDYGCLGPLAVLAFVLVSFACSQANPAELRHWTPTPTLAQPVATETRLPTRTTEATESPRPLATLTSIPLATVSNGLWNCREDPTDTGVVALSVGSGQQVELLHQVSEDGRRVRVRVSGVSCWVVKDALK